MTNNQPLWLPARADYLAELDPRANDHLDRLYDDLNDGNELGTETFRRHLDDLSRSLDDAARFVLDERHYYLDVFTEDQP